VVAVRRKVWIQYEVQQSLLAVHRSHIGQDKEGRWIYLPRARVDPPNHAAQFKDEHSAVWKEFHCGREIESRHQDLVLEDPGRRGRHRTRRIRVATEIRARVDCPHAVAVAGTLQQTAVAKGGPAGCPDLRKGAAARTLAALDP